jgi:DNA recombination-dependent growth factor C
MLDPIYFDKLLDEIQLRWDKTISYQNALQRTIYLLRFRDMFQDNLQADKFLEDCSGFGPEFTRALKLVEEKSRIEKLAQQKSRKFEESEKSQKSIKSQVSSSSLKRASSPSSP